MSSAPNPPAPPGLRGTSRESTTSFPRPAARTAAKSDRGENSTAPLDPQVLGPLLVWAIRFVDDFANDILAAWSERCRLFAAAAANQATAESQVALEESLLSRVRSGTPLPSIHSKGRSTLARTYTAALTAASVGQVNRFATKHQLYALVDRASGSVSLARADPRSDRREALA